MENPSEYIFGQILGSLAWLFVMIVWWNTDTSFLWMFFLATVLFVFVFLCTNKLAKKKINSDVDKLTNSIIQIVLDEAEKHIETLLRKRRTLLRIGEYGEVINRAWISELETFLEATAAPILHNKLGVDIDTYMPALVKYIDDLLEHCEDDFRSEAVNADSSSGVEYEAFCESLLKSHGWKVFRTQSTGDQGVDIIAERAGRRVAIQCKRHNRPIGNKAVQEVFSGMDFYEATEAIVVSNSVFTLSANTLASKLGVALIHHDALSEL